MEATASVLGPRLMVVCPSTCRERRGASGASGAAHFLRFFGDLPDPRGRNSIHKLGDMIVIAVMAVICGADGWADVELFGKTNASGWRCSWTCRTASPPTTPSAG